MLQITGMIQAGYSVLQYLSHPSCDIPRFTQWRVRRMRREAQSWSDGHGAMVGTCRSSESSRLLQLELIDLCNLSLVTETPKLDMTPLDYQYACTVHWTPWSEGRRSAWGRWHSYCGQRSDWIPIESTVFLETSWLKIHVNEISSCL